MGLLGTALPIASFWWLPGLQNMGKSSSVLNFPFTWCLFASTGDLHFFPLFTGRLDVFRVLLVWLCLCNFHSKRTFFNIFPEVKNASDLCFKSLFISGCRWIPSPKIISDSKLVNKGINHLELNFFAFIQKYADVKVTKENFLINAEKIFDVNLLLHRIE